MKVRIQDQLREWLTIKDRPYCRSMQSKIADFITAKPDEIIFILYGLRCTGKTTMMAQTLARMESLEKCAFILVEWDDEWIELQATIDSLEGKGVKIFS